MILVKSGRSPAAVSLSVAIFFLTNTLIALEDHSELYQKINPSVVTLKVYDSLGTQRGQGSGFVVSKKDTIATCYHVIEQAEIIQIHAEDGTILYATAIAAADSTSDVALLRSKFLKNSPPIPLTETMPLPGSPAVAIGSPLGMRNTISTGIISGIRPESNYQGKIQFTTPISSGSSGGPLLTEQGNAIGMVTATEPAGQNINFAIAAEAIQSLLDSNDKQKPFKKLKPVSEEIKGRIEGEQNTRNAILRDCAPEDVVTLDAIINEAISTGVPVYNSGFPLGCAQIYEGAAYKILNKLGDRCESIRVPLEKALLSADESKSSDQKAWIMRSVLDSLIGAPTQAQ